jgi:hypothetical protein
MNLGRTFYFAATPEQAAEGQLNLCSLFVILQCVDKYVQGFVMLLVEQKIKAPKIRHLRW